MGGGGRELFSLEGAKYFNLYEFFPFEVHRLFYHTSHNRYEKEKNIYINQPKDIGPCRKIDSVGGG